jgi:hypothetical protein
MDLPMVSVEDVSEDHPADPRRRKSFFGKSNERKHKPNIDQTGTRVKVYFDQRVIFLLNLVG